MTTLEHHLAKQFYILGGRLPRVICRVLAVNKKTAFSVRWCSRMILLIPRVIVKRF